MKIKNKSVLKEKGITLVSLVITVIIMLILTSVSVVYYFKGGLINTAQKAVDTHENAYEQEKNSLNDKVTMGNQTFNSVSEYIESKKAGNTSWGEESPDTGAAGEAVNVQRYGEIVKGFKSKDYPTLVWRIFYEDAKYVYLISETAEKGYPATVKLLENIDGYPTGETVSKQGRDLMPLAQAAGLFEANNDNDDIRATAYMCDVGTKEEPGPWDGYRDKDGKAVWAMAGPTIELFAKSYNAVYADNSVRTIRTEISNYGYTHNTGTNWFTSDQRNGIYNLGSGYWLLASPSNSSSTSMRIVKGSDGDIGSFNVKDTAYIRPIVCIPRTNFEGLM